jgi:hypothetical protein
MKKSDFQLIGYIGTIVGVTLVIVTAICGSQANNYLNINGSNYDEPLGQLYLNYTLILGVIGAISLIIGLSFLWRVTQETERERALTLICIGIVLLVTGSFFGFSQQGPRQGYYTVKAGSSLELQWYLEQGDDIEGGFIVSGGNGQANLIVKNPSGGIIANWTAVGRFDNGFLVQQTGIYTVIFKNLDSVHDQIINVYFSLHDNFHIWNLAGLLMILLSIPFLLSGIFRLLGVLGTVVLIGLLILGFYLLMSGNLLGLGILIAVGVVVLVAAIYIRKITNTE